MRVPLPQQQLRPGSTPALSAPGVDPVRLQGSSQVEQLGQTLQTAGGQVVQFGGRLQDQLDATAVSRADNLYADRLSAATTSYLQTIGADATTPERRQGVLESIDRDAEGLANSLANETQRELFMGAVQRRRRQALAQIDTHFTSQVRIAAAGEAKAKVERALIDGVNAVGQTEPLPPGVEGPPLPSSNLHLQTAIAAANDYADQLGLPVKSERRAQMLLETTTKFHAGAIAKLLRQPGAAAVVEARTYFEEHRDQMDPDAQDRVIDQLTTRSRSSRADLIAATAIGFAKEALQVQGPAAQGPQPLQSYVDAFNAREREFYLRLDKARAAVLDNFDPSTPGAAEMFDEVNKRLDQMEKAHTDQLRTRRDNVRQRAEQWLNANPRGSISDLSGVDPELFQDVQALALQDDLQGLVENGRYTTDPEVLSALRTWSPSQWLEQARDPAAFDGTYASQLSPALLTWAHEKMDSAAGRSAGGASRADAVRKLELAARGFGLDPDAKDLGGKLKFQTWLDAGLDVLDREAARPKQPGEKPRTIDETISELVKAHVEILDPPPNGGEFDVNGRRVYGKFLDPGDSDLTERMLAARMDPADMRQRAVAWQQRDNEARQQLVASTTEFLGAQGVAPLPGLPGYVPLEAGARAVGMTRAQLLQHLRDNPTGEAEPLLDYVTSIQAGGELRSPGGAWRRASSPAVSILTLGRIRTASRR